MNFLIKCSKKLKRKVACILAASLVLQGMMLCSFAEDWEVSKSKVAETLSVEEDTYRVVLGLPAADKPTQADIVFVIDKSMSRTNEQEMAALKTAMEQMIDVLAGKTNVDIKAGIVTFNSTAHDDTNGLVSLNSAADAASVKAAMNGNYSSGTNIQDGVEMATDMLNSDTSVEAKDKYMVLLTDGGSTYYNNINGKGVNIGTGQGDFNNKYNSSGSDLILSADIFNDFVENGVLANGIYANGNYIGLDEVKNVLDQTAAESNAYGVAWTDPGFVTQMERGNYLAAQALKEFKGEGYKCIAVGWPYYPNLPNLSAYAKSFMDWIGKYIVEDPNSPLTYDGSNASEIVSSIQDQLIYMLGSGKVVDQIDDNFDLIDGTFKLTVGDNSFPSVEIDTGKYGFGTPENDIYPYTVTYEPNASDGEQFTWEINVPVDKNSPVRLTYDLKLINTEVSATYPTNKSAILYYKDSTGVEKEPEIFDIPYVDYTRLNINKELTGNDINTEENFTFTVEWSNSNQNADIEYPYIDVDGRTIKYIQNGGTVTLKGGQGISIKGLPMGTSYNVSEVEANKNGYNTSYTGVSGIIRDQTDSSAVITNSKDEIITPPAPPEVIATSSVAVKKVWAGDYNINKPESVEVQLYKVYADGTKEEEGTPIKLNSENNWTYKWDNLPQKEAPFASPSEASPSDAERDSDGILIDGEVINDKALTDLKTILWTVDEISILPSGYTKKIENIDGTFIITNTYTKSSTNHQYGGSGGGSSTNRTQPVVQLDNTDVPTTNISDMGVPTGGLPKTGPKEHAGLLFVTIICSLLALIVCLKKKEN